MIVVDTSALMAIVQGEPEAGACMIVLERESEILISATTLAEALIVAQLKSVGSGMGRLINGLGLTIVPVTSATAVVVSQVYERWGKGFHPASLNFGDCFAYALAQQNGWPLLYVGKAFVRTDVVAAVP